MINAKRTVELMANVAIVAVCALLCWSYATRRTIKIYDEKSSDATPNLTGVTLPDIPGYAWNNHSESLVLALRVGCHFCQDSMPFYRKLSGLQMSGQTHAHFVVVMPDDKALADAKMKSEGLRLDGVFGQPLDHLKVTGTPTLLLTNSQGKVERAWVGELTPQDEQDVIAAVRN